MIERWGIPVGRLPDIRKALQPADALPAGTEAIEVSDPVGVLALRAMAPSLDGQSIVVAVIDSGCNADHDAFKGSNGTSRVLAGLNFTDDGTGTKDDSGHGTAIAGVVAGLTGLYDIATAAKILPLKVVPSVGEGDLGFVLAALTQVFNDRNKADAASVVCLSVGDKGNYRSEADYDPQVAPRFEAVADIIRKLRASKIPTVVATGNSFKTFNSAIGMCFPAIVPECLSVGAVFATTLGKTKFPDYGDACVKFAQHLQVTPYSQRLPRESNQTHYTRLFAPGSPVISVWNQNNSSLTDEIHGTSIAAPFVAGIIALLQQHYKSTHHTLPPCNLLEDWLVRCGADILDNDLSRDNTTPTGKAFKHVDAVNAFACMTAAVPSA